MVFCPFSLIGRCTFCPFRCLRLRFSMSRSSREHQTRSPLQAQDKQMVQDARWFMGTWAPQLLDCIRLIHLVVVVRWGTVISISMPKCCQWRSIDEHDVAYRSVLRSSCEGRGREQEVGQGVTDLSMGNFAENNKICCLTTKSC